MPATLRSGKLVHNGRLFSGQRKCLHRGCHHWTMSSVPYCGDHMCVGTFWQSACIRKAERANPVTGRKIWANRCSGCSLRMMCHWSDGGILVCSRTRWSPVVPYCAVHRCVGDGFDGECPERRVRGVDHRDGLCEAHFRAKEQRCMRKGCKELRSVQSERGFCGYHRMVKELRVVPA